MKKSFLLLLVALMTLALVSIALSTPINNVSGTKHNLSTSGTGSWHSTGDEDQICVFCHTPHQVASANKVDPLWNHSLSGVTTYGVYSSATLNALPEEIGGGTTTSNLCMSCHDGTVAVNSMYNPSNDATNTTSGFPNGGKINSNANIDTDLSDDHPVNFTYDAALATSDGGLVNPTVASTCNPGSYQGKFTADYPNETINSKLLVSGKLQCSSCHGAHIYYGGTQSGYAPFLKVDNTGSGLCLSCHCK